MSMRMTMTTTAGTNPNPAAGTLTLEQVYQAYYPKVLRYLVLRVNDSTLAEDIASDVFLKVAEHLAAYDPAKAGLSTWIYTIANHTLTDYFRSRRVFSEIPDENGGEGTLPDALVDSESLDQPLLQEEQLQKLAVSLQALSQRERDLIILHYYSGLTLKVVAMKLGMSYVNAKVVHKKALTKLSRLMSDGCPAG